jgi:acyl-coenzyme A thioesterase PaaI-like protein
MTQLEEPAHDAPSDGDWLPPHQPHCLGCGDANPASPPLRMRLHDNRVVGEVTFDRRHEGAPGFAHGGAVAVILDDALGTLLMIFRRPAVTARLEVDYRSPVFLHRRLDVEAWVERVEGRKLHLRGKVLDEGRVLAEGFAIFVEVPPEHFLKGGAKPPEAWTQMPW